MAGARILRVVVLRAFVGAALFVAAGVSGVEGQKAPALRTTHFTGGRWFDGRTFVATDFYAVGGVLSHRRPKQVDETVDLMGGFVVPPFGDAHEHNFDSVENTPAVVQNYLRDGIFYAQGMTDITSGSKEVVKARMVNTPETVDVTYAHGSLTGAKGHPHEVYEQYALGFYTFPLTAEQKEKIAASTIQLGNAYWEVSTVEQLDGIWPKVLAAKPDLIKIILVDSGNSGKDPANPPLGKGLDPALIAPVVKRAHATGLKVAAHVDTAADFHNALVGGVDEMAHLPGYYVPAGSSSELTRISDDDVALAARRKVKVIATAGIEVTEKTSAEERLRTRTAELDNLMRLKRAGVTIQVGSDWYGSDTQHEIGYLHELGVWSNTELLTMYAVATPKDIFPARKLGELKPGYEASFLVLIADPLKDWSATGKIQDRWKQGVRLQISPAGH
jgi:hypothetical protein